MTEYPVKKYTFTLTDEITATTSDKQEMLDLFLENLLVDLECYFKGESSHGLIAKVNMEVEDV